MKKENKTETAHLRPSQPPRILSAIQLKIQTTAEMLFIMYNQTVDVVPALGECVHKTCDTRTQRQALNELE